MSGVVSFSIAIWEAFKKKKVESRVFFIIGAIFLIIACDQAWQDEHNNVKALIAEKATLWQERDFWKSQSYQKDAVIRSRDDLLGRNYVVLAQTQNSLANLSNRLLDVSSPPPRKIDAHRWRIPETYTYANVGKVQFWTFVITSNKPITPTKGTISCDADFQLIETTLITHGNALSAGHDTLSPRSVHVEFLYPPLSAENPLVFFVFTKEGTQINECSFTLDK